MRSAEGSLKAMPVVPSLTGMRWAAAFLVFGVHIRNFDYFGGTGGEAVNAMFRTGTAGVSFFFILSGFVLAWTARDGDRPVGFWRRRFARVYPVHLVTAIVAFVLGLTVVPRLFSSNPGEVVANLLLVAPWNPHWWQSVNPVSWSLACEAAFYLVFPFLFLALRRLGIRMLWLLAAASVAAVIAIPFLGSVIASWHPYSFPPIRLPEFVLGAALGLLVRRGAWRGPGPTVSLAVVLAGFLLAPLVPSGWRFAACTVVGFALLIPAAARADLRGGPSFWRAPVMVRLGELSYSFYMVHLLVLLTVAALWVNHPKLAPLPALGLAVGAFAVALAGSWLLYRGVEVPMRKLLLREPSSKAARVPAPSLVE